MYTFADKGGRPLCLIPEATGVLQELVDQNIFENKYPQKVFYVQRCYRYESPQSGRYREFIQLGVEFLTGPKGAPLSYEEECKDLLRGLLDNEGTSYEWNEDVKRGLTYYTRLGFEASCASLGAQKQIAGGGTYKQGVGFAIGVERWLLALGRLTDEK